jgi:hypothetical protein
MTHTPQKIPISQRPPLHRSGDPAVIFPRNWIEQEDEQALGIQLMCDRKLFGLCYLNLAGNYFWEMPRNSGVFVAGFVPSSDIIDHLTFPGDIDFLIIPYEDDKLVVSRTMAVELKIVRASYDNQGKSPNRFGFSQAQSLLDKGFSFVSVIHLFISNDSPEDAWRDVQMVRIVEPETGEAEFAGEEKADLMPADLIERGFGRLKANRPNENIGVVSAYLSERHRWQPMGRPSLRNSETSHEILEAVGDYYHANYKCFMDMPRYDPDP